MELLRSNLSRVQIPEPTHRIYKHECCLSFDTPVKPLSFDTPFIWRRLFDSVYDFQRSEGGLFVDMNSFLAFGKDYVSWNYEKTRNPVYLHIKESPKSVPEDRPLKKPTLLAIGITVIVPRGRGSKILGILVNLLRLLWTIWDMQEWMGDLTTKSLSMKSLIA